MTTAPKFEFGKTKISTEELTAELAATGGSSKYFEPGNYTLKVTEAAYHTKKGTNSIAANDPSWVNVVLTLEGADGRKIRHWVQVPTSTPRFIGKNGKSTLFPFKQLQAFAAALGVTIDASNYTTEVEKLFNEAGLKALVGAEVNLDIGFTGPYVKFVEKGKYKIVMNGTELADEFPDIDSAKVYALTNYNKNLETFAQIVKFNPAAAPVLKAVAQEKW